MSIFGMYLEEGLRHILDPYGYDHILFVAVLSSVYLPREWSKLLVLITAFTIGHSITLALATLNYILVPSTWVELLIPITILATASYNLWRIFSQQQSIPVNASIAYSMALVFGLIHGLGFSNFLRSILGESSGFISSLLAFNLGLELGQLVVVSLILGLAVFIVRDKRERLAVWTSVFSCLAGCVSLYLIVDRAHFLFA